MRKLIGMLTAVSLLAMPGFAQGQAWRDQSDGQSHTPSDNWPLPTRPALIWSGTLNVTAEQCDGDTDGSADNYTLLQEDADMDYCYTDDGGSFVDDTTDCNDAGTTDVNPFPATPAVNDAFYIGDANKFNAVFIDIGTAGSTVMTVTWEYYSNDDAWTALTFNRQEVADFDETAGNYYNDFQVPSDWAQTAVDGTTAYWIRARVSAYTSITTQAALDQAQVLKTSNGAAHQIIITPDSGETASIWCDVDNAPDVDEAFEITSSPRQAMTVEVDDYAREVVCCAEGGTAKLQILLMNDGVGSRKVAE